MSLTHPNIEEDPILPSENLSVLFANPNQDSLSQSISNHKIIINPSAIWNVLALIQQSSEEQQLSLLEDLVSYINAFPINSLTLVSKTTRNLPNNTSHSVIDRLLQLALQIFDTNPRVSNKIVELLVTLYQYNVLEKSHLNILYSHLSERFYSQKLNSDILLFSIQLLQKTISQQIPRQEEPSTFFYFPGSGSSLTVDAQQPLNWANNNGLALSIWFFIENNDSQPNNTSKLITLHSDGYGGVEVFFKGQELHYRTLNRTYSEPSSGEQSVLIGNFQASKWYYLGLEHENAKGIGKPCLKIVINNECKKPVEVALPSIEANSPITRLSLGENFIGRISSFILFKHSVGQNRLSELYSLLNYGVHNENVLKNLYATIEKILDRVAIFYTPQRSDANKVFDVLNNAPHATLTGNAGVGGKDPAKLRFGALGGVSALLPFFNFLKYVDVSSHPDLLDELWKLILDLFTNFSEAQFEASKIGFFRVVGQLLAENEKNLWISSSIELLADVRSSLTHQNLSEEMFVDLLWNQRVFSQANEEVQNQLWIYLKSIYLQNPAHYDRLFNIRSILDLIIDKYDAPFQTITANNTKNDWSCTTTPEFKDAEKNLGLLLDIVESILSTGGEAVTDGLISALNVLSLRCSAYLHLLLLRLLKNILVDKRDNSLFTSKAFIKTLTDHKASQHILYLISQTTCLDLKAMCIKLLNVLLSQSKNNANKGEITQYICNIIWSSSSSQKDQEINFDQLFAKNDAPNKTAKIETDFPESLTLAKVSKSFPKTSKLSLAPFDEEPSFSKSATSSFLQNSFQSSHPRELMSTDTDKKLTEMSLNLRNSVPRDRMDETGSFRKDKTFEFSRKAFGSNDSSSSLSKTSEISFPVHDEPVLDKPIFPKKKAQASSSSTGRAKKGFPGLTIAAENGEEEAQTQSPAVPTETQEEKPVVVQPEEEKKSEEFVLEKPFPKAGDLKRKPKNLAIVAETNEEPTEAPTEVQSTTQSTLSTTKGPRGFGLSLDTIETQPEEPPKEKEIVVEPKIEVTENLENRTIEVDVTVEIPKELIIETTKQEEPSQELELELPKPKPKAGVKSTKKGGKLKAPAFKIELDVDSINQEFTFGGEKGAKHMDEEEVSNLKAGVLREVMQLAKECVEYMLMKEKEEEEKLKEEQARREEEQDQFSLPEEKPKEEDKQPEDDFRPPKNMPQSVRGHKKIEFGFKGKPSLEIGGDALNQQTTLSKADLNSFKSLKPSLDIVQETPAQPTATTPSHREEYQLSTNLDVASPEQNQPIIFKTTPKGQTSFPSNKQGRFVTEVPSKNSCYEGIYNALIEWLLHKQPSHLLGNVTIDDTDKISCVEVLPVMIKFYKNADEPGKQKMMQDLYILLKWNQSNCSSILQSTDFHFFLLDILYDYQILLYTNELEPHATAIWELGTKSHTVLLKHALLKEHEGYKFAFNLFIWLNNKRIIASNKPNPIKYEQGAQYLVRHLWLNFLESINDAPDNAKIPLDSPFWTNIQQVTFYTQEIVVSALTSEDLNSRQKEANKISSLANVITKLQSGEDFPYNFKAIFKQTYWADWNFCKSLLKALEPLWTPSKTSISRGTVEDTKVMKLLLGGSADLNVEGRGCLLKVVLELIVCYFEDSVENNNLSGCEFVGERIRNLVKPLVSLVESLKTEDEEYYNSHKEFLMSSLLFAIKSLYQIAEKNSKNGNKEISEVLTRSIVSVLNNLGKGVKPTPSFKKGAGSKKPNLTLGSPTLCATLLEILGLEDQALANLGRFDEPDEGIIYGEYQERITEEEKTADLVNKYYGKDWIEISQRIREGLQENISQQNQKNSDQERTSEEALEKSKKEIVEIVGETCENEGQRRKESIKYHEEYSKIRNGQWSKLWRKLRTYVGPWRHPDFYDQVDVKEDAESADKREKQKNLLKHKLAKSEVKSRAKPFLKIKLIEPQYVEGYEHKVAQQRHEDSEAVLKMNETLCQVAGFESKSNKEESKTSFAMPLGSSWKGSSRASGASGTSHLSHMIGSPLKFDNISGNKSYTVSPSTKHEVSPREEVFLSKKCQWIKPLHIRHGTFQITSHRLIFTSDEHQDSSELLFLKDENTHSAATQRMSKEWPLDFIREIQKKQFFLKRTGLEIYMVDGSTLLFNFPEGELEEVSQKLVRMRKTRCPNLVYYGSLDSRKIIDKANITKKWLNYEMTNFEYLMWLNSLSGRSFNDLTQYPIFPWILADYASSELNLIESQIYRDFSKPKEAPSANQQQQQQQAPPMQPPENRKKKGMMISIPDSADEINALVTPTPQVVANANIWHCPPLTVVHFLQRLDPYSQAILKLQKKGIRYPYNKPLDNLEDFYKKSSEELIPEFFCLADFLSKWEDKQGDQIELPKWCHNNPQRLVATLRKALESAEVSKMLHHWIDIVFGYKQNSKNVQASFPEEKFNEHLLQTGQPPLQLFNKPHPQRSIAEGLLHNHKLVVDPAADVRVYRPPTKKKAAAGEEKRVSAPNTGLIRDFEQLDGSALIKMKVISDSRLIGLRKDGRLTYFKWWSAQQSPDAPVTTPFKCGIEKEKFVKLGKGKHDWCDNIDYSVKYITYPATFLNMGKIIVAGGYWDGRLSLFSTDNDSLLETYFYHSDTITAIASDHKENFLITGSKSGECIVWKISPELTKLTAKFHFYDHNSQINDIFISNDLRLFATASNDGKINIYHFIVGQLLRTIHHPSSLPIQSVVLSSNPLPCVIFSSEKDQSIYSYSINGKALEQITTNSQHITSPLVIKDANSIEHLVYGTEKGELFLRKLPFLEYVRKWDVALNCPVLTTLVSKDKKYMFCGCSDGEFSVLTDPSSSIQPPLAKQSDESDDKDHGKE